MIPTQETKKLRAFHGDKKIKQVFLDRVTKHEKADEIIRGRYWEGGKGCAVGCTLERQNHQDGLEIHEEFERQLGIPAAIASLEDYLFETMEVADSKMFPRRFLEAIKPGAQLHLVAPKFIVFVLKDVLKVKEAKEDKDVAKSITTVIKLWEDVVNGKVPKSAAWSAARSAAWSAARSAAESAAWSAAASKYGDYLIKLLKAAK